MDVAALADLLHETSERHGSVAAKAPTVSPHTRKAGIPTAGTPTTTRPG